MNWYGGSIPAAIQDAKAKRVIFAVYIYGVDELSKAMDAIWQEQSVVDVCHEAKLVALKIEAKSEASLHFAKLYPFPFVPCVFFIGENGVPLEATGNVPAEEMVQKIRKAMQLHKQQLEGLPPSPATTPASPPVPSPQPTTSQPPPPAATASSAASLSADEEEDASVEPPVNSSSTEEEEKAARIERAQELIRMKQAKKAEEEKEKEKEKERERREPIHMYFYEFKYPRISLAKLKQMGRNVAKLKQFQMEQEAKELKDQMKKDKDDEKKAKERVRAQIAQDRAERAAKFSREKAEKEQLKQEQQEAKQEATAAEQAAAHAARMEYARIQFRLPDGSAVTNQFSSAETLGGARQYLIQQVPNPLGPFTLGCTYPKKDFSEAEMNTSLRDLGLAPSAALIVLPGSRVAPRSGGGGGSDQSDGGFIWMLLAPLVALWNFIYNMVFGTVPQAAAVAPSQPPPKPAKPQPSAEAAPSTHKAMPSQTSNRPKSSYGVRRRDGNMHRLRPDDSDEDMSTYNGNSTQQL